MKIDEILSRGPALSFEVFPPKPGSDPDLSGIGSTLRGLTAAEPDFVSVTYGAGGSNRSRTLDIVELVLSLDMIPLSHLTAVGYTKKDAGFILEALARRGVKNVLALRGDMPQDSPPDACSWKDFTCARDLSEYVSGFGDFCVGGAAYPEGHQQSVSPEIDLEFMKAKAEAGVTFFITQLSFDNDTLFSFIDRVRAAGIDVPVLVGIMPIFAAGQINRIVEISGCKVPPELASLLERFGSDDASMVQAGADYAAKQIRGLWDGGVSGVHVYTMNKCARVLDILSRCGMSVSEERYRK